MNFGREDGDTTEEDVLALMRERDGESEESEEDEPEEEPEAAEEEEDEPEEEQETDDEEEEPEGDEDSEIDWDSVPPRVKQAYEQIQSEAQKWKKDYGKIQGQWTKASQTQKEFESTRSTLEQRNDLLTQFEELLENNPKIVEFIQKETARKHDPFNGDDDVPDYLKQDPAYKHLESRYKPLISSMQRELNSLKQKTSRFDEMDKQEAQAKSKQQLDTQLDAARGRIKSIFGRDASEGEVTQVLEYMVDKKFYGDGSLAALAVFGDKYEKAILSKHQTKLKEKAKKFGSRNRSVSSSGADKSSDKMSTSEAIARALADQGY